MLYRNLFLDSLLLGLCSTAFASPLEMRATGPVDTTKVLQQLAGGKPLPWQDRKGGKVRVLTIPKGQWAAAENAVRGGHKLRRSDGSLSFDDGTGAGTGASSALMARQGEAVTNLHTKCYNSGSWALDTTLVPLITSICDEGAYNWFLDAGSAQVLHFLGLTNEKNDQMSVFVTLRNHVDGIYSGVDANACTTMAETLILQNCQGKNGDTRGGVIYAKNLQGQDSVSLAIDPTTDNCNC